jgi:CheY-like chemotaxis protein
MPELHLYRMEPDGRQSETPIAIITRFPCVIGRRPSCDCCIEDHLISRQHCALLERGEHICVQDLGSTNGTRLNGLSLKGGRPLEDGDWLEVGRLPLRVRFPAVQEESARPKGRHVLVVENDFTTAKTLALQLASWGHHVQVARDGPEAIEAAKAKPPEIVFLDMDLPSMSGLEVARRLRAEETLRDTRLVAVTGDEGATEVLRSRERFEQLLVKPVSSRVLRAALSAAP